MRVRGWTVAEPILEREEGTLDIAPQQGRESGGPHYKLCTLYLEDAKPTVGTQLGELIGLAAIRAKCSHFNGWLTKLELLEGVRVHDSSHGGCHGCPVSSRTGGPRHRRCRAFDLSFVRGPGVGDRAIPDAVIRRSCSASS